MKCYNHPLKDAALSCSNCGRFICEECIQIIKGRNVCSRCQNEILAERQYQPVTGGIKFILYMVSFLFMPLGVIIGTIFYSQPDDNYHRLGRNCLVIAFTPFLLFCTCFLAYFFFAFGGLLGSGLIDKAIHLPVY